VSGREEKGETQSSSSLAREIRRARLHVDTFPLLTWLVPFVHVVFYTLVRILTFQAMRSLICRGPGNSESPVRRHLGAVGSTGLSTDNGVTL
jgi:hypothetical protein